MPGPPGCGPPFDSPVPPGGYAWWYLDAVSDDGRHGLALIAFVGSVFSPYYAARRRRHPAASALEHCAMNVALYGDVRRWAMTERDASSVLRTASELRVGPSRLHWHEGVLDVHVTEVTVPWPTRLQGRIRVRPLAITDYRAALDTAGRHRWRPVAPRARVELEFTAPALRWSGHGYLDSNCGDEPLEAGFRSWHWSRTQRADGTTHVYYDVERRDGTTLELGLSFDREGRATPSAPPPPHALPVTLWRVERLARIDPAAAAALRPVEDTPFYARSMVLPAMPGQPVWVHESLSLDRFRAGWVQSLLPFRMGRRRSPRA